MASSHFILPIHKGPGPAVLMDSSTAKPPPHAIVHDGEGANKKRSPKLNDLSVNRLIPVGDGKRVDIDRHNACKAPYRAREYPRSG